MTPLESKLLQQLGIHYLRNVELLAFPVFFYGAPSSLVVHASPSTSSIKGAFVVLFSASVVIFMFVFSFLRFVHFLARPNPPRFRRRRGFSNRLIAAMFVMTVINFLLSSLYIGAGAAFITVYIRKALILNTDHPLPEKGELIKNALQSLNIILLWSGNIPVGSNMSLVNSVSIHARWRYYSAISL